MRFEHLDAPSGRGELEMAHVVDDPWGWGVVTVYHNRLFGDCDQFGARAWVDPHPLRVLDGTRVPSGCRVARVWVQDSESWRS